MTRASVDKAARIVSLIVVAIGVSLVVLPLRTNVTALLEDDPFSPGLQTTRTAVEGPMGTITTITEAPGDAALVEQIVGRGGLVLVRLAVVAGAAFLAGALVQRILLASFPIEVAGLKFPEVADASEEGLEEVSSRIDDIREAIKDVALAGAQLGDELWEAIEEMALASGRLAEQVDLLESRIQPPPDPPDHEG